MMKMVALSAPAGVKPVSHPAGSSNHPECASYGEKPHEISKIGWGGARANSGGHRPGAGRKPHHAENPSRALEGWFVFSAVSTVETVAAQEISRLGYRTYLPLIAIRRRAPGTRSWHVERVPMFPGYGFVWLSATDPIAPICALRVVRDLLRRADGRPALVPLREIEELQAADAQRCELAPEALIPLHTGAKVLIETGAFEGRLARVVHCDGRVTVVEVPFLGRPIHALLARADLTEVADDRVIAGG